MKIGEFRRIAIELGWELHRMEGGPYISFSQAETIVYAVPSIKPVIDGHSLDCNLSVSTSKFEKNMAAVVQEPSPFSIAAKHPDLKVTKFSFLRKDIEEICQEAKIWAETVKLENEIIALAKLPTNQPGISAFKHIVALIMTGQRKKVEAYRHAFQIGDRLGFVPMVEAAHFERALALDF